MGDKEKLVDEKSQPNGPLSQGQFDLMRSPKAARPLLGLRTHVTPLQIPFGLQYQGSSPRKHSKRGGVK